MSKATGKFVKGALILSVAALSPLKYLVPFLEYHLVHLLGM